jgi:hypothetical protein
MSEELPGVPEDGTNLTHVLKQYEDSGFSIEYRIAPGPKVARYEPPTEASPEDFVLHSLRRLEGASEPDEMMAVAAISRADGSDKGVLVLPFGPNMSEDDAELLRSLEARRVEGGAPFGAPPSGG